MKCQIVSGRQKVLMMAIVPLFVASAVGAFAQAELKLKRTGELHFSSGGTSSFFFAGTETQLGSYRCYAEIDFVPGGKEGTLDGDGVAVIETASGDVLVAEVAWRVEANGSGQIAYSWQDAVEFDDGTVACSTGRFGKSRPRASTSKTRPVRAFAGIIGILIG